MHDISYSVLIPVYNASESLPELLKQITNIEQPPKKVFVVDDGSTDGSYKVAEENGAEVIKLTRNNGKGFALKKGFESICTNNNLQYVLCMDADLQHPVESIPGFLEKVRLKSSKVIIGQRNFKFGQMPFLRFLSNTITSLIISKLTGQDIKDSQCGFRLIHTDILTQLKLHESGFQMESEFILRCAELGIDIDSVPVPTIYNGKVSNIRHFNDTARFLALILGEIKRKWFMNNEDKK